MRSSLWLKLMGILGVIIGSGALMMFLAINLVTATQFRNFVLSGDLVQAQNLSVLLADYYAQQGSWDGVESLLTAVSSPQVGMMGGMMEHGMMRPGVMEPDVMQQMMDATRVGGAMMDRVVLAAANGVIVADSADVLVGEYHPAEHLATGAPIIVDGQQVGTVLVGSMVEPVLNPLDQDFLRSVNLAVLLSSITVGIIALVLGSIFFFHMTAPVRDLTQAAEAIAAGDLSQRVSVRTGDEIGRLAQAFNTMADALDRAGTLRRQMVADIAHELRTPLSLVQGNLEAILDGLYALNLENVASVHEETVVLTRLVNDLRDLALAESGQLHLEQDRVDVADWIAQGVERFRAQAAEQSINLITDVAVDLPPMRGDGQRLGQVLMNLLSNAMRYTPAGGQVVVAARLTGEEQFVGDTQAGEHVEGDMQRIIVSVTDSGQGIPAEDLAYVFERFYRADKSRTRASGGSGLGLAIARQIVEAHGGRIWAESREGVGSTFSFILPTNS